MWPEFVRAQQSHHKHTEIAHKPTVLLKQKYQVRSLDYFWTDSNGSLLKTLGK
jgi:hypothetical protein